MVLTDPRDASRPASRSATDPLCGLECGSGSVEQGPYVFIVSWGQFGYFRVGVGSRRGLRSGMNGAGNGWGGTQAKRLGAGGA